MGKEKIHGEERLCHGEDCYMALCSRLVGMSREEVAKTLTPTVPLSLRARVGRIHSVETGGAVDGPGLRYVIFTQGCLFRCRYCHNPDTWALGEGREVTVGRVVDDIRAYLPFLRASHGGVTVSGGEPLLQADFVAGLFEICHRELHLHTALDSNGYATRDRALPVLQHTDLVLLDIKHMDPHRHHELTGMDNRRTLEFAHLAAEHGVSMWIRYVVVPGWTDDPEAVERLGEFAATLPTVEKVELLPYHLLGRHKWKAMGLEYSLEGVEPPSDETLDRIRRQLQARGLPVG